MRMKTVLACVFTACLTLTVHGAVLADQAWVEGRNYFLITPPHPTGLPAGKVEVTEVFSYACPACNVFQPTMRKLKQSLPANAVLDYLAASFNRSEDWPMFQQAFYTAQVLGIAERTHDAMFEAVWTTHELAVVDPVTERLKPHPPDIADAARFYQRQAGVPAEKFLDTAKSFAVDTKVRTADDLVRTYLVDRTPTIIVNGKYRLHPESAGGADQVVDLVRWLVAKESR